MWINIHRFLGSNRIYFDGVQFVVSGSHFHQKKQINFFHLQLYNINFYIKFNRILCFGLFTLMKRNTTYLLNDYIFIFSMVFQLNLMKTFFLSLFPKIFFYYLTALSTVKWRKFYLIDERGECLWEKNHMQKCQRIQSKINWRNFLNFFFRFSLCLWKVCFHSV